MNHTKLFAILALALSVGLTTACGNNDNNENNANNTNNTNNDNNDNNDTDETPDVDETEDEEEDETDTKAFVFATEAPSAYVQVDRIGVPAVNTALVSSKDDYNKSNPTEDAESKWAGELVANLTGLHEVLRDDLMGAGLARCSTGMGLEAPADGGVDVTPCLGQEVLGNVTVQGAVIPDVLNVVPSLPAGFPNGRKLEDPVIDIVLAVILLDITADGQDATSLVGVLNPAQNDINGGEFNDSFPYLLPPQTLE